jgi:hypothetical protein
MVLRRALAFARVPFADLAATPASPADLDPLDAALLDRFAIEIEAAAVSCAALLTLHAAEARGQPARLPDGQTLVPYIPLTFAAVATSAVGDQLRPDTVRLLDALPHLLSRAKSIVENLLFGQAPAEVELARGVGAAIEPLRTAATLLMYVVDDLAGLRGARQLPAGFGDIARTLRIAIAGGAPLLTDGVVVLPATTIVMRGVRRSVDIPATLAAGARRTAVRMQNVSQGGYCVRGASDIAKGDRVRLTLAGGRTLAGRVEWTRGDLTGVRLDVTLPLSDPLINR